MKRDYRNAYNALAKMKVPVYEHADDNGNFSIDAEASSASEFVDYYSANPGWIFGVSPKVNSALQKRGLYAEWVNPGRLAVYGA